MMMPVLPLSPLPPPFFEKIVIDDDKQHFPTDDDGADEASRPMPPLKSRVENRSESSNDDDDDDEDEDSEDDDDDDDNEEDSESGSGSGRSTDDALNISEDLLDSSLDGRSGGDNEVEDEAGDLPVVPVAATYKVNHGEEEMYELSQTMVMPCTRQDYNRQFD